MCPTITHNKYTAASSTPIGSAGGINSHFFKGSFTDKFEDKFYRYNTNAVDYYYIDVTQSVVNKFVSPFVFEIFFIFCKVKDQ